MFLSSFCMFSLQPEDLCTIQTLQGATLSILRTFFFPFGLVIRPKQVLETDDRYFC